MCFEGPFLLPVCWDPMKDPARIRHVIEELEQTWEGQPDLSLSTLFGILDTQGIRWGSSDEELVDALRSIRKRYPPNLPTRVTARYVVDTESPAHRISLDPFRACIRRLIPGQQRPQPGVWDYDSIVRCRVGDILVICDEEKINHKFGVVSGISLVNDAPAQEVNSLDGARRRDMDNVYWIDLVGGHGVLLDHGMDVYTKSRRHVEHRRISWETIVQARHGSQLQVQCTGGEIHEFGQVERIISLEG